MLRASNLFCERDERVLFSGLDLELSEGQILQLQGSNGSGKTTLMRILCGLNDSYEGQISWYGEAIEEQTASFFSSLLYIGHRVGVSKALTPLENLRWSCSLRQQTSEEEILKALAEVGLRGFEESPCYTLSAGQQQRVSLARLLINPARLWILDEPFTTLDKKGVDLLETLLQAHVKAGGAVMVTTHHKLDIPELSILSLG
ncbi:MAG: heme ABC transporter ATP-binding protein CcmA [SAR86 cluster bacterium]|uniref:Heme ABC transporter ATP-binding protein CcmA n=1 Tax=SAR86 cluster bacterium TaxID=2030880 RepID=A0A2A5AV13_9GAMM|nr:MAG: heme ABC transporter ATP-binding protein CcmA [SAR86 cluster bacterium]